MCPPCPRTCVTHVSGPYTSPKESRQRKGDPTVCDPPLRYGQPAVLAFRGVSQNSLRSNSCEPLSAKRCAPRRSQRGVTRAVAALGRGYPTGLRFARPRWKKTQGPRARTSHTRTRHGALTLVPSGCAEERRRKRDQGRSCLSGAQRSEFCGPPLSPSTAGCPQRSGGTQTAGSPSFAYFSWRDKKSKSPAGARPGQQPKQEEQPHPTRSTSSTAKATPANRESSPRTEDSINPTGSSPAE